MSFQMPPNNVSNSWQMTRVPGSPGQTTPIVSTNNLLSLGGQKLTTNDSLSLSPLTAQSASMGGGADLSQLVGMLMTILTSLMSILQSAGKSPTGKSEDSNPAQSDQSQKAEDNEPSKGGGCGQKQLDKGKPPEEKDKTPDKIQTPEKINPTPGGGEGNAEQQEFLRLVNEARAQNGLKPVKLSSKLNQAATDYSGTMARLNKMDHEADGTNFGARAKAAGYEGARAENIAKGTQDAKSTFDMWMNSPGHRANIMMEDATEIGIGRNGDYWTQMVGSG